MPKELGDEVGAGTITQTLTGDGSASAGDAVALNPSNSNKLDQADADTAAIASSDGVAADDFGSDGDAEKIVISGLVVANVDSGIEAGERLNVSSTAGRFRNTTTGDYSAKAFTSAGGTWGGASLGANEAVIYHIG